MNKQEWLEYTYSKKHISNLILDDLQNNLEVVKLIEDTVSKLTEWAYSPSKYQSKDDRKSALIDKYTARDGLDLTNLVEKVLVLVTLKLDMVLQELIMACTIDDLDERNKIILSAEVIAICAENNLFDIEKEGVFWYASAKYEVDSNVREHINQTTYLPPLIIPPNPITNNTDTPYYTYESESMILGHSLNYHNKDICLDVINIQNNVPLALSRSFMAIYEEPEPDHAAKSDKPLTKRQIRLAEKQWQRYESQCQFFNELLSGFGNRIYLGNKVDKRGRLYASGYHISPQGNSYRKAVLELADAEMIEIPEGW